MWVHVSGVGEHFPSIILAYEHTGTETTSHLELISTSSLFASDVRAGRF